MIELVLDQAGEFAEFGQVLAKQANLVHRAQHAPDIAALIEDGQKGFPDVLVGEESFVN